MNPTFIKILIAVSAGVAALFAVDFIVRKAGGDIAESISNINEGTPFEDTGPIGTLGNVTNVTLFGAPAAFGSWLGLQGSKLINLVKEGEFK